MTLLSQTQILERLNQASSLLVQRRPADAAAVLAGVVAANPEVVEASRLLGIALRLSGDLAGAERVLRASIPHGKSAGVYQALAETLELAQRRPEAEQAYRSALAISRFFPDAAIGLSELLLNENRVAEALAVITPVGQRPDADIHALSAYGLALKASERFDEAIDVYARAVARTPNSAVAEHNLAAALADASRFAEAEAAERRALAKGIEAPQAWLTLARALQGQDRYDEALLAYRQAIERDPGSESAHAELAQLLWMRTEDLAAASAPINTAIAAHSTHAPLIAAKAQLFEYAGGSDAGYAVLDEAISRGVRAPALYVQASYLIAGTDPELALAYASRAVEAEPASPSALNALCLANLAAGNAEAAANIAQSLLRRLPNDQKLIAALATAWRLMGDPRYQELYDYDAMVRAQIIDTPKGWTSLADFLQDLTSSLNRLHPLRGHPIGQSLRQGTQTQQRLDRSADPVILSFFEAIDGPVRRYMAGLGQGADPLRSRNTGQYRIEGVWSARLRPHGYHTNHVHQKGWLSSACHISLPPAIDEGREGWLKFGEPGVPTRPSLLPEALIKPQPGFLVLFPSYMWHGTVPFGGDESRLSIALDIVPA